MELSQHHLTLTHLVSWHYATILLSGEGEGGEVRVCRVRVEWGWGTERGYE